MKLTRVIIYTAVAFGVFLGIMIAQNSTTEVMAAGGKVVDPKGTAPNRYVYYPGTEPLGVDEIRLIACGTGMPSARRSQAATCFLVELGDGQKFLFDIGSGSHANLTALMIPADYLTKVFLTHLHTDFVGGHFLPGAPGNFRRYFLEPCLGDSQ